MRPKLALRFVVLLTALGTAPAFAAPPARQEVTAASPIDCRWAWIWTTAGLERVGLDPHDVKTEAGPGTCVFANGRYLVRWKDSGQVASGRFTVSGDVLRSVADKRDPRDETGKVAFIRFSIFRDRLTWSKIPGRFGYDVLPITPWTRVR